MTRLEMVDWDLATATATRLAKPGPSISATAAASVVAELRDLADEAEAHVRGFTGLAPQGEPPPTAVIDRPAWIRSNVAGFRAVLSPLVDGLLAKRARGGPGEQAVAAVGRKVTGVQLGTVLAYLSARVIGQYEVFLPEGEGEGRLLLVAPNVVATEQSLGVVPRDFRLWVCLHEVTHRSQFTAVPWLRDHVRAEIENFVDASDLDPAALLERLRAAFSGLGDAIRGRGEDGPRSVLELIQTPEQRAVLDRLQAFMSLVEGHAEFVMNGVGPEVIGSLTTIRTRFEDRRAGAGPLDRVIRRLLGIDLKMRQYAEGATFVGGVVERAGMDGFNRVWTSPNTLPTRPEIADPDAWVRRVLGARPAASA